MRRAHVLALLLLSALASACDRTAVSGEPDGGTVSRPDASGPCTPCGHDCCAEGTVCNRYTRSCELPCTPDCQGRSCGADGCGGECGYCGPGTRCDFRGTCVACVDNCVGRQCGSDGCGATCGGCTAGEYCTPEGRCTPNFPADASVGMDASTAPDASLRPDASAGPDAGPGPDAGSRPDAGAPDAGGPTVVFRVLFDNTKAEQAGNADWVIDDSGRFPSPTVPAVETDWYGGISSWGFELQRSGRFSVETLAKPARITFGDASNPQDLGNYDVYVVPEPNVAFTPAESAAIVAFVRAGGGLFMAADHGGSDRNNDGIDSPAIWNALADAEGNPFGIRFAADDLWDAPDSNVANLPGNSLLHGPFGDVQGTTYYAGSTMNLDTLANPTARGLIWKRGAAQGATLVTFATAQLGAGRVAAIGDSSPLDDGTGADSALQNGWTDPLGSNRGLMLNATAWLAGMTP